MGPKRTYQIQIARWVGLLMGYPANSFFLRQFRKEEKKSKKEKKIVKQMNKGQESENYLISTVCQIVLSCVVSISFHSFNDSVMLWLLLCNI